MRVAFRRNTRLSSCVAEAVSLAKELKDAYASAVALFHAAFASQFDRNVAEVDVWHQV